MLRKKDVAIVLASFLTLRTVRIATALAVTIMTAGLAAQDHHQSRFEMTESFIRNQWHHPIRMLEVVPQGAGPVHQPPEDCEIHVGAELVDQSISDFPGLVLEPPNVCKDKTRSKAAWRTFYDGAAGKTCSAVGFVRAWPEHLDNGTGPSNPPHFMELHPLRELSCSSGPKIDLRKKLKAFPDLGYKEAALVDVIFRTFRLWVRRNTHPDAPELTSISFDYYVCDREETKCGNRTSVPNFARLSVRPIPATLRTVNPTGSEETFKTLIARASPHAEGDDDTAIRSVFVKLYAVEGTDFYEALADNLPAQKNFDVLGIFTIDPLSVIKTLDAMPQKSTEWAEVSFPIAIIVFGQMLEE